MRATFAPLVWAGIALLVTAGIAPAARAQSMGTISGNGVAAFAGDGGPALAASHANPVGIAVDPAGNVFVADVDSYRVRKITPSGIITTYAGNGQAVFVSDTETAVGDGGPATSAAISPRYLATDASGNLFIADMRHHRIRKVTPAGTITTVAGSGVAGYSGDGGAATSARFQDFGGITVDKSGNLFISSGNSVRKVSTNGIVTKISGAPLTTPMGLAFDAAGNLFVADYGNHLVRRITPSGTISTVLGGGVFREGVFANNVEAFRPIDVAVDSSGYVYVAQENSFYIRKVSPAGIVSNAAGYFCPYQYCPGSFEFDNNVMYNEGGGVFQVNLSFPRAIDIDASDRLLISDTGHNVVRRVSGPTPPSSVPDTVDVLQAPQKTAIAGDAVTVDIGDFNGDGRADVAVATKSSGTALADDYKVLLYLQQVGGSFAAPVKASFYSIKMLSGTGPTLHFADLNHDGRKDIVVSDVLELTVFLGNVAGALVPQPDVVVPATGSLSTSVVTDVDHDGHLDVVASGSGPAFPWQGVWVFRGKGDGNFYAPTFTRWDNAGRIELGDLNNDGNQDLATSGANAKASILFHDGSSGYRGEISFPWLDGQVGAPFLAADVNDDSRADLLVGTERVSMLLQEAEGRLDGPRFVRFAEHITNLRAVDMNGDGRLDLLGWMGSWGIGYLQRSGSGYSPARNYYVPMTNANYSTTGMATGKFDGDNCPDLALAAGQDGLTIVRGKNCLATFTASDVDGDGKSDVAWVSIGKLQLWPAASRAESLDLRTAPGWQLAAVADVSGDGRSDLIWRNCVNDLISTWDGTRPTAQAAKPGPDKAWRLVATADFDGNGHDDFLWQHVSGATRIWFDGNPRRGRKGATLAPGWAVVATGRFDGDAKADVFWRHGPTGANLIWLAGGSGGALRVRAVLDKNWQVAGSGDVDDDGHSDLLWRNRLTGANTLWKSADPSQQSPLPTMADPAWTVAAVADTDGDHRADVLWHHAGAGVNLLWPRADPSLERPASSAPPGSLPWKPAGTACARPAIPTSRSLR